MANRSPTTNRSATSADRGVRVAVDDDDRLGGLHPDPVLHRARDAQPEVQRGLDDLAGLADLARVRDPAGVDGGPRRADHAAQLGCASSSTIPKPSGLPTPRPPTTTIRASSSDASAPDSATRSRTAAAGSPARPPRRGPRPSRRLAAGAASTAFEAHGHDPGRAGEDAARDRLGAQDARLDLR